MFEPTPILMISMVIFSSLIGGLIGSAISKILYQDNRESDKTNHTFHIDKATGIVSDVTFVKYTR